MSRGQKLLEMLTKCNLYEVLDANGKPINDPLIFVWSSGAEEQLDAMVTQIIEEEKKANAS